MNRPVSGELTRKGGRIGLLAALSLLLLFIVAGYVSAGLRRGHPPPGVLVSVGDRKLHLYCTGNGKPTIVLESGIGVDWVSWRLIIPQLTGTGRVCVYDRAGYGWSDPGPKSRTALRLAGDLHRLLENAGVPGPYLLVAHSFGAYIARVFAAQFRASLSGLVLIDPSDEDEPEMRPSLRWRVHYLLPPSGLGGMLRLLEGERSLPPELRNLPPAFRDRYMVGASYREAVAERAEYLALPESKAQARAAVFPPDLPLTVVTATFIVAPGHDIPVEELVPGHLALQAKLARMSSRGKQIVAPNSGHIVQLDRPELVVRAIQDMIRP